jgi:hypothetical protein
MYTNVHQHVPIALRQMITETGRKRQIRGSTQAAKHFKMPRTISSHCCRFALSAERLNLVVGHIIEYGGRADSTRSSKSSKGTTRLQLPKACLPLAATQRMSQMPKSD